MSEQLVTATLDDIGRAIHAAKRIGGPWGPPCSTMVSGFEPGTLFCEDPRCGHLYEQHNSIIVPWGCSMVGVSDDCVNGFQGPRPNPYMVQVEYNDNSSGDYACLCESMAAHLIELIDRQV